MKELSSLKVDEEIMEENVTARINELKKKADQIKKKSIESYGKQEDTK